jgi:hypothetical protein
MTYEAFGRYGSDLIVDLFLKKEDGPPLSMS